MATLYKINIQDLGFGFSEVKSWCSNSESSYGQTLFSDVCYALPFIVKIDLSQQRGSHNEHQLHLVSRFHLTTLEKTTSGTENLHVFEAKVIAEENRETK